MSIFNRMKFRKNYNINIYIIIFTITVSIICKIRPELLGKLILSPSSILFNDSYWQLLTYAFVIPTPIGLIFEMLFLWFIGSPIENEWGSFDYTVFYVICTIGAGIAVLLMPLITASAYNIFLYSPGAALLGLIWIFSKENPNQEFHLMLFIPVKAKYFVLIYVGLRVILGGYTGLVLLLIEFAGCGLGLLYRFFRTNFHNTVKNIKNEKKILNEKAANKKIHSNNKNLLKDIEEYENKLKTSTLENKKLDTELQNNLNKKFNFEICDLSDFERNDKFCNECEAYKHCLAKDFYNKKTDH